MRSCYILNATAVGFADARATCQALGGSSDLVEFTTGQEQLLLENYFAATGTLPADYWIGIFRTNVSDPYLNVGGSLVSTIVGNANPYAHW